jgi:MFS family permease
MARLFVDISPLRESRSFRLLFTGHLASMLGNQLTIVAIAYQVYQITHSSLWVGLVSLFQLPFLIWGSLWGGAIGDRTDKKRILSLGGVVLAFLSAGLALNASLAHPQLWFIVTLSAGAAFGGGFVNPARNASIPRLVDANRLVAAYSLNQVGIQVATVVGPALSGVLLASLGVSWCYWLDVLSFVIFVVATVRMDSLPPSGGAATSSWRATKDGLAYLRSHRIAQGVYVADLNAMIFGMPRALFPAMGLTVFHGGPQLVGLFFAAPGVGALIGALTTGWVEHVDRRGRAVIWAVAGWGVAIALFGLSPWSSLALVALAVAGWADVISAVLRNAILQSRIEDQFRGRLSAIQIAVVTGGPRLGDLESGAVASLSSTAASVVSGGLACAIGAFVVAWHWRSFWFERASELESGDASRS